MGLTVSADPWKGEKPRKPQPDGDRWVLFSPQMLWQAMVGFDPKSSRPPVPKTDEEWVVGWVQNVLYGSISIEYFGIPPLKQRWSERALDSAASRLYRPFLCDPWKSSEGDTFRYRPAVRINYGPKGIKVLHDLDQPRRQAGSPIVPELTFFDRPYLKAPDVYKGKFLKRVEFLHVFKCWVMAQSPEEEKVALVHSDEYSVVSVANFSSQVLRPTDLLTGATRLGEWETYGVNGRLSAVPKSAPSGDFKAIGLHVGEGRPPAVYSGETAVERAEKWLRAALGLSPPVP